MNINMRSKTTCSSVPNSATRFYEMTEEIKQNQQIIEQRRAQSDIINARLLAGAEANIVQKTLFEQQIQILQKQNNLLSDNYSKLKELFDEQVATNEEAKDELKRSKRFNIAMMIIAIIAMIAAVAGPIVTILVSQ